MHNRSRRFSAQSRSQQPLIYALHRHEVQQEVTYSLRFGDHVIFFTAQTVVSSYNHKLSRPVIPKVRAAAPLVDREATAGGPWDASEKRLKYIWLSLKMCFSSPG